MSRDHDKVCAANFASEIDKTICRYPSTTIVSVQRVIIYPNYIDSKKTVAEGRRIPKDKGEVLYALTAIRRLPSLKAPGE